MPVKIKEPKAPGLLEKIKRGPINKEEEEKEIKPDSVSPPTSESTPSSEDVKPNQIPSEAPSSSDSESKAGVYIMEIIRGD